MDKDYFNLAIKLNECSTIALAAGKNVLYMVMMIRRDPSLQEYVNKLYQMDQELPHLLLRVEQLRRILEEFNRISMQ